MTRIALPLNAKRVTVSEKAWDLPRTPDPTSDLGATSPLDSPKSGTDSDRDQKRLSKPMK